MELGIPYELNRWSNGWGWAIDTHRDCPLHDHCANATMVGGTTETWAPVLDCVESDKDRKRKATAMIYCETKERGVFPHPVSQLRDLMLGGWYLLIDTV